MTFRRHSFLRNTPLQICILSSLSCLCFFLFVFVTIVGNITRHDGISNEDRMQYLQKEAAKYYDEQNNSTYTIDENCQRFFENFNIPVSVLLIDEDVMRIVLNQNCDQLLNYSGKMRIGVSSSANESFIDQQYPQLSISQYINASDKDYLDFSTNPRRIIPKRLELSRVGNFLIPGNWTRFIDYWKRSKFINCMNMTMNRTIEEPVLMPELAVKALSVLRDVIIDHGMYPFLIEGTLLGWYRECNIIPHTHDMDIAIFKSEYNPQLQDTLSSSSLFKVLRVLGQFNDSQEFTVDIRDYKGAKTDIFLMYREKLANGFTYDFIGGTDSIQMQKLKFIFPEYDPWCAADLLGHIFWVTCSPNILIPFEYGNEEWMSDYPTKFYSWFASQKNTMLNGRL